MPAVNKKTWGEHPLSLWLLGVVVTLFGVVHVTTTNAYDNELKSREKAAMAALSSARDTWSIEHEELEKDLIALRQDLERAKGQVQQIELKLEALKQVKESLAKIEKKLESFNGISPKVDRILDLLPRG